MNISDQFDTLLMLIDQAEDEDFLTLEQDIADFRDAQDIVACEEGTDCICERFERAREAAAAGNGTLAAKYLRKAKKECITAVRERIEHLEEQLNDDSMDEHTYQGTLEMITRLEGILEEVEDDA